MAEKCLLVVLASAVQNPDAGQSDSDAITNSLSVLCTSPIASDWGFAEVARG